MSEQRIAILARARLCVTHRTFRKDLTIALVAISCLTPGCNRIDRSASKKSSTNVTAAAQDWPPTVEANVTAAVREELAIADEIEKKVSQIYEAQDDQSLTTLNRRLSDEDSSVPLHPPQEQLEILHKSSAINDDRIALAERMIRKNEAKLGVLFASAELTAAPLSDSKALREKEEVLQTRLNRFELVTNARAVIGEQNVSSYSLRMVAAHLRFLDTVDRLDRLRQTLRGASRAKSKRA